MAPPICCAAHQTWPAAELHAGSILVAERLHNLHLFEYHPRGQVADLQLHIAAFTTPAVCNETPLGAAATRLLAVSAVHSARIDNPKPKRNTELWARELPAAATP